MGHHRESAEDGRPEVVVWSAASELEEAGWIASLILDLADAGARYRDIAVLVRGRASYPRLVEQFAAFDIPVQPGGRSGLFDQPEAVLLGQTITWLTDIDWRDRYGPGRRIGDDGAARRVPAGVRACRRAAQPGWALPARVESRRYRGRTASPTSSASSTSCSAELDVRSWDLSNPLPVNRLGTLARFSALLADYESVRRRARPDPDVPGEQVGGQDRGTWYYRNLGLHIINYAQGAYEGFDGEADFDLDAVDLTTVHRAKGLEWPAVFVPSVTAGRFPSRRTGEAQALARAARPLRRGALRGQRRRRAPAVLRGDDAGARLAVGLPPRAGHQAAGRAEPVPLRAGRAPVRARGHRSAGDRTRQRRPSSIRSR